MCVSSTERGGLAPDEATLFQQAQAGCPSCLNALMTRHEGLVQAVVRQQVLGALPFAEALQAARLGLWRAIRGFDPARGWAFSTYAWPCMMHHIWQAVKSHARARRPPPVAARPRAEAADPAGRWEAAQVRQALGRLVARLPARLRYVIVAHYGLTGRPPQSYAQIGRALGLCRERVRQLHTEALVWLRQPARSQELRSLLDCHTRADYQWAETQAQRWLRRRGGRRGH
jgi:RNA polymerase sigma factor (sigma-70 family)